MSEYSFGLPLKHNFAEYVWYDTYFTQSELQRINQNWDGKQAVEAELSGGTEQVYELRKSSIISVAPSEDTNWLFERLKMLVLQCNAQYYHFDLLGFHEPLQLAQYKEDDLFDWHLDFGIGDVSHRKLSISVQLSDPEDYEGGDLQFRVNQRVDTVPRKKGTVIIFPSFIMHRVTPITKGERRSIVGWVAGPPYR